MIIDLPKGRYLPFFSHNTSAALPLPENATLLAMLSELYLAGFFMGFYDDPKVLARSKKHSILALSIDSENPFVCFVDAFWNFLLGRLEQAGFGLEAVIQRNPDDIFLVSVCGYGLFALGEYERALLLIAQGEKINPFLRKYNQLIYFQILARELPKKLWIAFA